MRTPELQFRDVPPLFQQEYSAFFRNWAENRADDGPVRTLSLRDKAPTRMNLPDLDKPIRVDTITFHGDYWAPVDRFVVRPRTPEDLDKVVTWERKRFLADAELDALFKNLELPTLPELTPSLETLEL